MTHEGRAKLIKYIFFLVLAAGIVVGVLLWGPRKEKTVKAVVIPENGLEIVLYEKAGQPESAALGAILDHIGTKYDKLVIITHVDVDQKPLDARNAGVKAPPHVIMIAKSGPVFDFQGLWPEDKVERKVDEILNGLKRVGKDWRPPVPGMKPAGS